MKKEMDQPRFNKQKTTDILDTTLGDIILVWCNLKIKITTVDPAYNEREGTAMFARYNLVLGFVFNVFNLTMYQPSISDFIPL